MCQRANEQQRLGTPTPPGRWVSDINPVPPRFLAGRMKPSSSSTGFQHGAKHSAHEQWRARRSMSWTPDSQDASSVSPTPNWPATTRQLFPAAKPYERPADLDRVASQ